jgi:hypothetical protein
MKVRWATSVSSLDALEDLKGLTALTLNLGYSGVDSRQP